MLLKEFEKRENSFANKVNTKLSEKDEMQEKVREIPAENVRKVDCRDWRNALIIFSLPNLRASLVKFRVTQTPLEQTLFLCLPIATAGMFS